ncbi:MAG: pirin family protein [Arenicella sp.]
MKQRRILKIFDSEATSDGDGVKMRRVVTHGNLGVLDPFLLLDEFSSDDSADYIGGFPSHPHRGFETVTYMLEGNMVHKDHMGNEGHLKSGGVQWMTAGRGLIHSEMPEQEEGRLHGFQLWLNLPAKDKMQPARYQEFKSEEIPEILLDNGVEIRVIAGKILNTDGPVRQTATNPSYFDIRLTAKTEIDVPVITQHSAFIYVYKGNVQVEGTNVKQGQLAQLNEGDSAIIVAEQEAGVLFLSGEPINEPIANYGPFVMNTTQEIEQAISDYREGILTD